MDEQPYHDHQAVVLCATPSNSNCVPIAGATAQSYVLAPADVGGTIQVWETASNAGGSATVPSQFTGPVMPLIGRRSRRFQ